MRGIHFIPLRLLILASALIALAVTGLAADPQVEVTGISVTGSGGATVVNVSYRYLDADSDALVIGLQASADDGATWDVMPVLSLTGDTSVQATAAWTDGTLQWAAGTDWLGQFSDQMRVRVTASDSIFAGEEFVAIPAGTNAGTDPDRGEYSLSVQPYYIGKYQVTKALWDEVRNWAVENGYPDLPIGYAKGLDHPVVQINWYDAVKWCNARSDRDGLTPVYYTNQDHTTIYRTEELDLEDEWVKWSANGYRLPTEVEREYAARGGLVSKRFPWGDTITHSQANYYAGEDYGYDVSPSDGYHPYYEVGEMPYTNPVDAFTANGFGLYGMAGNVWEWNWNWHPDREGLSRLLCGGVWYRSAFFCRVVSRTWNQVSIRTDYYGFRLCSTIPPPQ